MTVETKNFPQRHIGIAVSPLNTHGQPLTKISNIRPARKAKIHTQEVLDNHSCIPSPLHSLNLRLQPQVIDPILTINKSKRP